MTINLGFLQQLFFGCLVTLKLAVCAVLIGIPLALLFAIALSSRSKIFVSFIREVLHILRGLPEVLILFAIYFGLTSVLTSATGHYVEISAFAASLAALTLIFMTYATYVFKGAFEMVDKGQLEAAHALGLSPSTIFTRIQLPLAWRHALPGLENLWLVLLKDTAIVMLIGMPDLMGAAKLAASTTRQPFTYYFIAACIYLFISLASQALIHLFKRQASQHVHTAHTILA